MSVLVAVPDSPEGHTALQAAIAEAQNLDTDLIVVNLSLSALNDTEIPPELQVTVIDRQKPSDRDPADAVLDEIDDARSSDWFSDCGAAPPSARHSSAASANACCSIRRCQCWRSSHPMGNHRTADKVAAACAADLPDSPTP